MKSLKIACDIDGVVSDFATLFLEFYNERNLLDVEMSEWTEWSLIKSMPPHIAKHGSVVEMFDNTFDAYCEQNKFAEQHRIEAGCDMVSFLSVYDGHDVRYFTVRQQRNEPHGYPFRVQLCADAKDKATKAAHWGADVFIDDSPDNYLAAIDAGIPLVLLWATRHNAAWRERRTGTGDVVLGARDIADVRYHITHSMPVPVGEQSEQEKVNPLLEAFDRVVGEWREILQAKNHDYAGNCDDPFRNLRMCEACGIPAWGGVVVRLTDKISRLQSFMRQGALEVKNESVTDTFDDSGLYSILGRILFEEAQK